MQPIPYLFFQNTCEEAMTFYGSVFGSEPDFMRVAGSPMAADLPAEARNGIMHAALKLGEGWIYASDDLGMEPSPTMAGCNVSVSLPTLEEARRVFDALSAGGEVRMPLEPTFWSAGFGAFTDRFGIRWMIDTDTPAD